MFHFTKQVLVFCPNLSQKYYFNVSVCHKTYNQEIWGKKHYTSKETKYTQYKSTRREMVTPSDPQP